MRFTWTRGLAVAMCCHALAVAGCGGSPAAKVACGTTGTGGGTGGSGGTGGAAGAWQYTNPVIKGDWSDPGVLRFGEDYYSVRSTFGWQPGLAVAHSKDLVHWEYVGNGFSSFPSIAAGEVASGIWGSEIVYNPNTSMFMIYATWNGTNGFLVFESATPEGPYAAVPGGLVTDGYDPGVFVDDDGRVYLVSSNGKIAELSADGKTVINPMVSSYAGWNEGPELFKRGSTYYVTWSSNGTERGANGIINSARSTTLAGPWYPDPANPVLQNLNNGTDPDHPFEGPQHPEVIETQNGEWFVTFHTWENNYGTLARNMCLEPVMWTDDGWWRPKNGKKPSLTNDGPDLPFTPYEIRRSDDFSSTALGPQWFFHTAPDASGASWSLSERPGFLRIKTRDGDVNGAAAYQGIPLQRIDLKRFDAETAVSFDAADGAEAAGLILHATLAFNVTFALTRTDTGPVIELATFTNAASRTDGAGATRTTVAAVPVDSTSGAPVRLKISFDGNENAAFSFSADGCTWQAVGAPISVGLGGQVDLSWRLQEWSGATIGLFAVKRGATADNYADFDAFTVTANAP
ncbi:MAG TPA: family 43 glycosylhydrolase [Polyangia bacterium]|jgi:xylan 1,4-beta-xylosidase|nr:family 43 glycosylhydrolase [Polyangia bacterium]